MELQTHHPYLCLRRLTLAGLSYPYLSSTYRLSLTPTFNPPGGGTGLGGGEDDRTLYPYLSAYTGPSLPSQLANGLCLPRVLLPLGVTASTDGTPTPESKGPTCTDWSQMVLPIQPSRGHSFLSCSLPLLRLTGPLCLPEGSLTSHPLRGG